MSDHSRPARVARLPYLNTAPFYLRWNELEAASEGRWVSATLPPRQLGLAAEAGEVDAGVMAVADLIRLEDRFEPLVVASRGAPVTFGIANYTRVESVFLFLHESARGEPGATNPRATDSSAASAAAPDSRTATGAMPSAPPAAADRLHVLTPREARACDGALIGITGETSTSFRLLRLLLEARHGVRPRSYTRMDLEQFRLAGGDASDAEAIRGALVIGDTALRWRHRPPQGFYLAMDLASEWHQWTGLPFVFARWGIRRSLAASSKLWLGRFLESSLRAAQDRMAELVQDLPEDLGPKAELEDYLRNFTYQIGPVELAAVDRFRALLAEHGISCKG